MSSCHLAPLPSPLTTLSAPAEKLTESPSKQMGQSLLQWVKLLGFNKSKLIKVFGTKNIFFHSTDSRDWPPKSQICKNEDLILIMFIFSLVSGMWSGRRRRALLRLFQIFKTVEYNNLQNYRKSFVKASSVCCSLKFLPII